MKKLLAGLKDVIAGTDTPVANSTVQLLAKGISESLRNQIVIMENQGAIKAGQREILKRLDKIEQNTYGALTPRAPGHDPHFVEAHS